MRIMLPQLAIINCIIFYHLTKTDAILKKTQDKNSIAVSSVAKTACKRKTAHQERRQFLRNPEVVLMGYLLHWQ